MSDKEILNQALEFARKNKKVLAGELTDVSIYQADEFPVSVFMAGSPGAGKTESAKNLVKRFSVGKHSILRIDPDDIRGRMPGYTGKNSSLFQSATSVIADVMQDYALKRKQSYIFDGTFTNVKRARENIQRSLNKGREVFIVYVYQNPIQAWKFVQARATTDGRVVPKDAFIDKYFMARTNVNLLKEEFGKQIKVHLIVKNIDGTDFGYFENIDKIDNYIPERYSIDNLEGLL